MSPGPDRGPAAAALSGLRHAPVLDRRGARLGTLEQVFVDARTGAPRWVLVAGGLYGMARAMAPACGMRREEGRLVLDVAADDVAHAPTVDPEDGVTTAEDALLCAHYRVEAPARTLPEAATSAPPATRDPESQG